MDWVQWSISQRRQMALMRDFWWLIRLGGKSTKWQRHFLILLVSIINRSMEIREFWICISKMRGFHYLGPIIYKWGLIRISTSMGTWIGMRPSKGFLRSFITPLIINHGPPNASIVFVNYGGFTMPSLGRKFCFENRFWSKPIKT